MARVRRAWFVVALLALAGLTMSSATAFAQASDDDDDDDRDGGVAAPADGEPGLAPADEPADGEIAEQEVELEAEEAREEADEETADALGGTPEEREEAAEERGDAAAAEEAAEEVQAEREPLPWRNTFFSWTHGVTPNTFFRNAQLSYNPSYYWSFNLAPRWYLDSATFFFVSQSLSYELTQDDGFSSYNHDLSLSDTIVELRRTVAWEGFIMIPAVRVVLPASKLSQAQQRFFGLGVGATVVRVIPEAWSLTIAAIGRYQYWFAGRNIAGTMGTYEGDTGIVTPAHYQAQPEGFTDAPMIDQATGASSPRHQITAGLNMTVTPTSGFTVSLSAFWLSMEGHGLADACYAPDTSSSRICLDDNGPTHWRHFTSLSLSIAYDVTAWFNLSLGWSNSSVLAPFFGPSGQVAGPFTPDNNFFLTASFQVDGIYEALVGGEDDGLTPEQRQRRRQGLALSPRSTGGSL